MNRPIGKTEDRSSFIVRALDWNRSAVHWRMRHWPTAAFTRMVTGARSLRTRVWASVLMLRRAATGPLRRLVLTAATGPRENDAAGQGHRYGEYECQNAVKTLAHRLFV